MIDRKEGKERGDKCIDADEMETWDAEGMGEGKTSFFLLERGKLIFIIIFFFWAETVTTTTTPSQPERSVYLCI